ncbi:MAG: hypothetical protein ACOCRO_08525 [Halanaerobiales bacterium]
MFNENYPAWDKENEVDKESEIDKDKEINKYSDCSNFWNLLFGEYSQYPRTEVELEYEERKVVLNEQIRKILLHHG